MIDLLEWGLFHAQNIKMYEQLRLEGQETPLDSPPTERIDLLLFMEAFWTLSNARNSSQGEPISLSEIRSYIKIFGEFCNTEFFVRVVQRMDRSYLNSISNSTEQG